MDPAVSEETDAVRDMVDRFRRRRARSCSLGRRGRARRQARKLSTAGAPVGVDPSVGRIDSGIEALSVPGSLTVTIERVGN